MVIVADTRGEIDGTVAAAVDLDPIAAGRQRGVTQVRAEQYKIFRERAESVIAARSGASRALEQAQRQRSVFQQQADRLATLRVKGAIRFEIRSRPNKHTYIIHPEGHHIDRRRRRFTGKRHGG